MAGSSPPREPEATASPHDPEPAAPAEPAIEADPAIDPPQDGDDADSAVAPGSFVSTDSLTDSIFEYRRIHGRTFQNSKTTEYWAPNDEQQQEGLDILHNALVMIQGDKLFSAPLGDNPQRVIDVGTGTGIWAIDFADEFPSAEVVGTDISAIQPGWVPPNLKFVIDDCLLDWTWPADHFDFVHLRAMYGSIPDFGALYKNAFKHLKPGGWLQNLEMECELQSDHVDLPPDHIFRQWGKLFYEGGDKMGRTFAIARDHQMRDYMEAAGFVNVVEKKIKMPIHGWARDKDLRHVGMLVQACMDESLEGFALFLFTQIMGWDKDEVMVLLAKMRREMRRKELCAYSITTIVYGQKPPASGTQAAA